MDLTFQYLGIFIFDLSKLDLHLINKKVCYFYLTKKGTFHWNSKVNMFIILVKKYIGNSLLTRKLFTIKIYWIVSRRNNRECVASIATVEQKPLSKNSSSDSEATATATATTTAEGRRRRLRQMEAATTATTQETTTTSRRLNNNNNSQRHQVVEAIIQNNGTTATTTVTMPKTVPKIRPKRLARTWPWTPSLRRPREWMRCRLREEEKYSSNHNLGCAHTKTYTPSQQQQQKIFSMIFVIAWIYVQLELSIAIQSFSYLECCCAWEQICTYRRQRNCLVVVSLSHCATFSAVIEDLFWRKLLLQ